TDRMHTVVAADNDGRPIRVVCGYCQSEHNYRGGPRLIDDEPAGSVARAEPARRPGAKADRQPFPIASGRERVAPPIDENPSMDIEMILRRVIREETGITAVAPSEKWRGGSLVLRPGTPGVQEKSWPIETFFHKVVMLRNRLRTLEQQVNA